MDEIKLEGRLASMETSLEYLHESIESISEDIATLGSKIDQILHNDKDKLQRIAVLEEQCEAFDDIVEQADEQQNKIEHLEAKVRLATWFFAIIGIGVIEEVIRRTVVLLS